MNVRAEPLSSNRYNPLVDDIMQNSKPTESGNPRAAWMRLLAYSDWQELEHIAREFRSEAHDLLRTPETGMVMLRGRMGSTGAAFNLGEATVTRCAVKLKDGPEGHAYVMGRNAEHARTAAICDALLQRPETYRTLLSKVLVPLEQKLQERQMTAASKAAATKVDFFTMVRGDV
jgi:alpha-D-ribose 1-methylphosphonate 5-triphosphate synthase subunit PhnG